MDSSFLTLSNTKALISLVRKHMSRAVRHKTFRTHVWLQD